jgi:phage gp45-like
MKLNELSSGDRFTVVVVVDGDVIREVKGVVSPPRVDVRVYQHEGGRVLLPQGTDVEVSGEASNISPDSNVAVKFVGLDSRSDIRREMDVVGNGEFRTTIDTTAIPVETEFRMVIDIDGGEVYNSKAVISGEKERNSSASETKQREGESRKQEAQREKERREEEKRREEQREEQPQSDSSSGENSESDAERPDNTGSDESDRSSGSSESVDVEVVVDAIIEWLSN